MENVERFFGQMDGLMEEWNPHSSVEQTISLMDWFEELAFSTADADCCWLGVQETRNNLCDIYDPRVQDVPEKNTHKV